MNALSSNPKRARLLDREPRSFPFDPIVNAGQKPPVCRRITLETVEDRLRDRDVGRIEAGGSDDGIGKSQTRPAKLGGISLGGDPLADAGQPRHHLAQQTRRRHEGDDDIGAVVAQQPVKAHDNHRICKWPCAFHWQDHSYARFIVESIGPSMERPNFHVVAALLELSLQPHERLLGAAGTEISQNSDDASGRHTAAAPFRIRVGPRLISSVLSSHGQRSVQPSCRTNRRNFKAKTWPPRSVWRSRSDVFHDVCRTAGFCRRPSSHRPSPQCCQDREPPGRLGKQLDFHRQVPSGESAGIVRRRVSPMHRSPRDRGRRTRSTRTCFGTGLANRRGTKGTASNPCIDRSASI